MTTTLIQFPGSNRDRDMIAALTKISGKAPHLVWHTQTEIPLSDLIVIPGGFSYGDYLRSGAIAARSPVMDAIRQRALEGVPVFGVCNGFQILTETGLLPGALMRNESLKFVCKDVALRVENSDTPFTNAYSEGQIITVPVAHHDGNYFADDETLKTLEGEGRVTFRYVDNAGQTTKASNPNGSRNNIAGIINRRKNILGMMPHPERLIDDVQ
ncbi:MAG: phosphoribosylformylglycinamidine synthase subunit PurQ, partial [Rhizobiaceae bacterium]|nr:phosphoribosylformylglycinamidine synthase subunit PurQ [Rhizobiaceae bacterium]